MMARSFRWACSLALLLIAIGCAAPREAGEGGDDDPAAYLPPQGEGPLRLVPASEEVRTIQLYQTGRETDLPVVRLGGTNRLQLEFDLLTTGGRPLSVYFYHADRTWRRDLTPGEYLRSFQRDDLLDYTTSQATEVPYVHYTYRFPNDTIDFLLSGNYIVRVTEQGMEDEVLFEQPFFVSEGAVAADMAVGNVILGGRGSADQPIVRFTPPDAIQADVYSYGVCFVRNGRFENARCTDQPELNQQPALQFLLEPQTAFEPQSADYFIDLAPLRVGNRIEQIDRSASPFTAVLEPDFAKFGGTGLAPVLNGQIVIEDAGLNVPDPDIAAQYVDVTFRYVPPDERELAGRVRLIGSFNGWDPDTGHVLTWDPTERRYEGSVLLKQGQYEYRYVLEDERALRELQSALPREQDLYAAFIYYDDIRLQTDRLLGVNAIVTR